MIKNIENINFLGLILLIPFLGYTTTLMILLGILSTYDKIYFNMFMFLLSYNIFGFTQSIIYLLLISCYKLGEQRSLIYNNYLIKKLEVVNNTIYNNVYYKDLIIKYNYFLDLSITKQVNTYITVIYINTLEEINKNSYVIEFYKKFK
jgi:hypothetical protein